MASKMMATVFKGIGKAPVFTKVPKPVLEKPSDVIVKILKTTICGTDLHILGGNVPQTQQGRILGHEGIGIVVDKGDSVTKVDVGDRVLVRCITACGKCNYCTQSRFAHCPTGGWRLGTLIDGMQAEYARVPHADNSVFKIGSNVKEGSEKESAMLMTADVLPTCYEIGLRDGAFPKDKDASIAVVGAGPLGLASILCAINDNISPEAKIIAIDLKERRLDAAKNVGANTVILNENGNAVQQAMELTDGKGVDYVVECVGTPSGWDVCQDIVAVGGEISILGVHGKSGNIKLEKLWEHNVSIHTGMVHGHSTPRFMDQIAYENFRADLLLSDEFNLSDIEAAYEWFASPQSTGSLKVVINNDIS